MITETLTPYFTVNLTGDIKLRDDLKIRVKKENPQAKIPIRAQTTDAGLELFSLVAETIPPSSRRKIPTGLKIAVPAGWALMFKDIHDLAYNNGIHVIGNIIDSNYRGDIEILLVNIGKERVDIAQGQKICLAYLVPAPLFDIIVVPSL